MTAMVVLHLLAPFLYHAEQNRLYTLAELIAKLLNLMQGWLDPASIKTGSETRALQESTPVSRPIITINQRYLGQSIHDILQTTDALLVKSPMGSGKTEAIKKLLKTADAPFAFASPSTKLNRSIAKELGAHFYKDVLKQRNKEKRYVMAQRVVGTLQFFRKILKEFPELNYDVFVIDESQAIATMLVSPITFRQEEVLIAVKKVAQNAKKVIAMDAHLGRETEVFMDILLGKTPTMLVNQSTPWQEIMVDLLTGGTYRERKQANDTLQIEALERGKRMVICSSSSRYCELRYEVLSMLYPNKKIAVITAKESAEAQALMDNPALITQYDVLILSPAVGIGVSFNAKNHMDCCFGVFPNKRGTGDSDSAIQMLARLRSPTDKHWIITLDNEHSVFTHMPTVPAEIGQALIKQLKRNIAYADLDLTRHDGETNEQLIRLFQTCEQIRRDNKNHYNQYFIQRLKEMSVSINVQHIDDITPNQQSETLTKQAKEAQQKRQQQAKTEGKAITEQTFKQIDLKLKQHLDIVSQDEQDSHAAFLFRKQFNLTTWVMTEEEKQHYCQLDAINAVEKCTNRELLKADRSFIKKVICVQLEGIGKNKVFKENVMSRKHNLLLYRKLLAYTDDYIDGTPYSHKSLKDGKMVRFVTKHYKEIVGLDVILLPKYWKQKPATLMNVLLRLVGYEINSTRKHNGKRNKRGNRCFDYTFAAHSIMAIDSLFKQREQQQQTWAAIMQQRMDKHEID